MTKLLAPRLRVTMEQPDRAEPITYDLATDNRDMVRWERAADKNHWPDMKNAPMLWLTHLSFTAARRAGLPVPATFEPYEALVIALDMLDGDGEPVDATEATDDVMAAGGFPTQSVAAPVSS
jgi:hypothetical protein